MRQKGISLLSVFSNENKEGVIMNKKSGSPIWAVVFIVIVLPLVLTMCSGGNSRHAPGYGNTSRCTICGKAATHHTSNYGFCDKHWKTATGQ